LSSRAGYGLGDPGFEFQQSEGILLFSSKIHMGFLGPPSFSVDNGLFSGDNGIEGVKIKPSNAEIKNK
jgi:hypothetical protein